MFFCRWETGQGLDDASKAPNQTNETFLCSTEDTKSEAMAAGTNLLTKELAYQRT